MFAAWGGAAKAAAVLAVAQPASRSCCISVCMLQPVCSMEWHPEAASPASFPHGLPACLPACLLLALTSRARAQWPRREQLAPSAGLQHGERMDVTKARDCSCRQPLCHPAAGTRPASPCCCWACATTASRHWRRAFCCCLLPCRAAVLPLKALAATLPTAVMLLLPLAGETGRQRRLPVAMRNPAH